MRLLLVTISALAALTAACDGERSVRISSSTTDTDAKGVLKVIDALQCPETVGALTRKGSAQAEGSVCTYVGPRGAEVSLHLVRLDDQSVDDVLKTFETQLMASMPHTAAQMQASQDAGDSARAEADSARTEASAAASASTSGQERVNVRMPGMQVDTEGERATVRMPGLSVDTDGDKAGVRIAGITIDADEGSQNVDITSSDESVSVQAHDDSAQIRTRAPGEALRTTYILTDNRPSEAGWRLVGYEARGPRGGPIVVATVRAKDRHSDSVFDDAKDLVALNVGE